MDAEGLVASWLRGRAAQAADGSLRFGSPKGVGLADKFRKAYSWISTNALLSPFAELEFGTPVRVESGEQRIELHDEPGFSAFVLLPLLNLMTSRRIVFVGRRAAARLRWRR